MSRVKVRKGKNKYTGEEGKVVVVLKNTEGSIGVEFDRRIAGGHDCNGKGKDGHCYYFNSSELMEIK